ncbi:unnamed protein product [Urochloa humidicola]
MEATVLSVGKSVLSGALSHTKSAISEEVALQLGVQRDQDFIREELEMMKSFLMVAHEERDDHEMFSTWVKQVRDVAYDAEDCLQDFSVHLEKPLSRHFPCTLQERHRIAKQMKELRARVEDVSQRKLRYHLTKDSTSKHATKSEQSGMVAEAIFDVNEARWAAMTENSKVDLVQLINNESKGLRVIAVWGTSGGLGQMLTIRAAYEDPCVQRKFPLRAWVRMMHPFNPIDFVHSLLEQFHSAVGLEALLGRRRTGQELAVELNRYMDQMGYLIVLNGLSSIEEWDRIRTCFPNNKEGSRIVVSTPHVEVANLCIGQEGVISELKHLYDDQVLYAFYEKDSEDCTQSAKPMSSKNVNTTSSNNSMMSTVEIPGNQSKVADANKAVRKSLTRIRTACALEESQLIGREKEKSDVIALILTNLPGQEVPVISVWGMGGLGKTILVKDVYHSKILSGLFDKRAFVTVVRPFVLEDVLKSLAMQLDSESSEKKDMIDLAGRRRKIAMMGLNALNEELAKILDRKRCLIVLDDLSSTAEWDKIILNLSKMENTSRIIVTTREENIAMHCSNKQENIYRLTVLQYKDALDLLIKKVFKESTCLDKYPELIEEADVILKKCNGLPLAIVTIGGFLANQPKTTVEWRKLNKHISAELKMNPQLESIRTILTKSYDGLPYHLKSCFLYTGAIFSSGHKISQRRLVRRWKAEGYLMGVHDKCEEEIATDYFMELIDRSMILPSQQSVYSRKGIDSCHIHDLMHDICISKAIEENLVFRFEEDCSSSDTQRIFRHLAISSNWKGDESEFESKVDLSRVPSLTVFGKVRPFAISAKMRLLRVLDLEDTKGLVDHHLQQIGKLYHLKYLSLRRCDDIYCLPDSFGNLRQLQTLDIAFTNVLKLPKTITKLTKLQFLCAGSVGKSDVEPKIASNRLCLLPLCSVACCMAWCAPQLLKWRFSFDGEPKRHDILH